MATPIAFLRAVNVTGHAVMKMEEVKRAFEAAGCLNVRTFIQSGNILFEISRKDPAALQGKIRDRLTALLGKRRSSSSGRWRILKPW